MTLFTGLTLDANTSYYLTLAPEGSVGLGANPIFWVTENPTGVPEPASLALMGGGPALLGLLHRRRRAQAHARASA